MKTAADRLFAGAVTFLKSAPGLDHLPPPIVPEVGFIGRSNVGKSSLLNALVRQSGLARTSTTPGRTQELNFFELGDPLVTRLVDMPGYGFAKAPKQVVEQWQRLVRDYLRGRQVLKRVLLLIDARHGIKAVDLEMMRFLNEAAVSYQVVLTKADKLKTSELAAVTAETERELVKQPAAYPGLIVTSAETGQGLDELRGAVLTAIRA